LAGWHPGSGANPGTSDKAGEQSGKFGIIQFDDWDFAAPPDEMAQPVFSTIMKFKIFARGAGVLSALMIPHVAHAAGVAVIIL
jgi:hypothetical protein